eukprot:CAMPEP_0185744950 /NCGR_PEP_ID=MMETSP1174-20130828/3217_1 /TAXON_ID=35687 /ORGANISM="Dictyocha speculum, Strain CCMP1381" /LENGTH=408 /DNA_ID=CAMNT_0028418679 /DNA_START=328 /DNA_END=1554 /DNA_ORIENTATION=-
MQRVMVDAVAKRTSDVMKATSPRPHEVTSEEPDDTERRSGPQETADDDLECSRETKLLSTVVVTASTLESSSPVVALNKPEPEKRALLLHGQWKSVTTRERQRRLDKIAEEKKAARRAKGLKAREQAKKQEEDLSAQKQAVLKEKFRLARLRANAAKARAEEARRREEQEDLERSKKEAQDRAKEERALAQSKVRERLAHVRLLKEGHKMKMEAQRRLQDLALRLKRKWKLERTALIGLIRAQGRTLRKRKKIALKARRQRKGGDDASENSGIRVSKQKQQSMVQKPVRLPGMKQPSRLPPPSTATTTTTNTTTGMSSLKRRLMNAVSWSSLETRIQDQQQQQANKQRAVGGGGFKMEKVITDDVTIDNAEDEFQDDFEDIGDDAHLFDTLGKDGHRLASVALPSVCV